MSPITQKWYFGKNFKLSYWKLAQTVAFGNIENQRLVLRGIVGQPEMVDAGRVGHEYINIPRQIFKSSWYK
ncbi:MAG: hypothetical protein K0R98_69 [Rickettsiaceae bacterium]|jgi:hypothetical protein|nr:hypothetical protein [Rickettsiaceae bacterium]